MIERRGRSGSAWLEAGQGPPVLFLHGLGGTSLAWQPQLCGLADRFRCIAWDMPGYGRSPIDIIGDRPLSFPAISNAVETLMGDLDLDRIDIVGLSFGGQQALHFALDHPDRIDRLILADTSASFGADGTDPEEWMRLRLDPLDRGLSPADMAEGIIDGITGPAFSGPIRRTLIESLAQIPAEGLRAAVTCLPHHDVSARLEEIAAETLVIVGQHDRETPVAYSRFLVAEMPNAELAVIPGVGHLSPSEDPATFNHLVAEFLAPRSPGTVG
ncbi:MAG: alpha/beta fold hydrolase [Acidimicrobiales bacterium]